MSDQPPGAPRLEWTGERYVPEVGGDIRLEHVHRYYIARELSRDKRVLDIACGEGYGADILASVASRVYGVDIAPEVIVHARSKYNRPNLEFRTGSCHAIPLRENSVDVVVSFETIEHTDRHEQMMLEIRRVMSPGGLLIISSPDRHQYTDVLGNRNEFHVSELDRAGFEGLLRSHFRHVVLGGQRVRGGSIVAPLDKSTDSRFVTFSSDPDASCVQGLEAPIYLLALASDEPVPPLPVGLADGGSFIWSPEFSRQAERVAELQTALDTARELEAAEVRQIRQLELRLSEVDSGLSEKMAAEDALRQRVRELESQLAEETARLQAHLSEALAQSANLRVQVETYEHSKSWRLTAPLRSSRRLAKSVQQPVRSVAGRARGRFKQLFDRRTDGPQADSNARGNRSSSDQTPDDSAYVPLTRSHPVDTRIKLIAFYLPQFHPIPENDAWWGKGFTEWNNVVRARPQFAGHYQPHLPGELGFYDLRLLEVQKRQIELAKLHGLHGFCYHHYWFAGKKLLRRPFDQLLAHPELDFPFCLCWANENWTRRWDGLDDEVLIAQEYSPADDLAFIQDIEAAFRDPRYLRIDGRPLLIVYRPALLPDARGTADRWRSYCRETGLGELFLASTQAFDRRDPREFGFDAALEFAPNSLAAAPNPSIVAEINPQFRGVVYDYRELVAKNSDPEAPAGYPLFRCVTPMWDNEARRPGRGAIFAHSSPAQYQLWLEHACQWTERHHGIDQRLVFVNAWNEWAEGAHLEPDQRHGYAYLDATADALERFPSRAGRPSIVVVSHDAYFHGAQVVALNLVKTLTTRLNYAVDVILCGPGPLKREFEALGAVHDFSLSGLTPDARSAVIARLYNGGARVAICNTSVVGETVESLKRAGFSVISLIHELPGLIQSHGLEGSIKYIAEHADQVVFPAGIVRDKFIELTGLPRDRSVVRPQGLISPNEFFGRREAARRELRRQLGLTDDMRIVLAVGYADHRKGIDLFVDVGIRVAKRLKDVVFVWVGHQERSAFDQARDVAASAGMNDRFVFPGPVRNSNLFFAGSDAYLMTSREDPFPNVVVHALDADLPVIGFEGGGGFVELLERGCGVLAPFGDTNAMAEAVLLVLQSPDVALRLSTKGREILARDFSFVNYARGILEAVTGPARKVSVIVPNFNYARYLPSRLKSIVDQTHPPHEILFLDDCSGDDSVKVAAEILHASGLSYRIITNDTNQGTYRQWLRGLREATGDLIWIAEADDECAPRFLEKLMARFDQPDVVLAYCQSRQIDEGGRELAPDYLAYTADISDTKWHADYARAGLDEIRDTLVVKNTIPNVSAVLMRRPNVVDIEQRLLGLRNAGDWLLYVHLLKQGQIAYVSDPLNAHRRHSASVTIGGSGLNLMREIMMVQQYVQERYTIGAETEKKREASLQATYEYLGLHAGGPASYKDHEALKVVEWAVTA